MKSPTEWADIRFKHGMNWHQLMTFAAEVQADCAADDLAERFAEHAFKLANPPEGEHSDAEFRHHFLRLLEKIETQTQKRHHETMIAQAALDTALANLTAAVTNATSHKPPDSVPSTPDTVVQAFVDGVAGQTSTLDTTFTPTATPPPTP